MKLLPSNLRTLLLPLLLSALWLSCVAVYAEGPTKTIDDRVAEIAGELMCPVCQGQSVSESNSELAHEMRSVIKAKLEQGETREQIIDYFVARYGQSVKGAPPTHGAYSLMWILPWAIVIVGLIVIGVIFKKQSNTNSEANDARNSAGSRDKDISKEDYEARIKRELESLDN